MKLVDIEIQRYRSVREQSRETSIEFEGLDCIVGKNNAGKTNILSAIKYLLDNPDKSIDDELYWQKNRDQTVDVRGFFDVDEDDLDRIDDPEKRESVRDSLITVNGTEGVLGICKRIEAEDDFSTKTKLLQFLPESDRLSESHLKEYREEYWEKQKEQTGFSKADYKSKMREEFGEIADLIPNKKQRNKGVWLDKYWDYIDTRPEKLSFRIQPTEFKDSTKSVILNKLLPRLISIPAIKEVESATKRGGEFGDLVDQISSEVQDELDKQLQEKLDGFQPRTHPSIQQVESHISDHLSSTFEEQSVKFDFPNLSTEYLFRNADIQIQEEHIDSLSKENVGEGVKRTLIFSLLRTLADLREEKFTIGESDEVVKNARPLLILYEEAELFLHPSLQKTLLRTFDQLVGANAQILFSTHSPVLIQHETLDTINIARKNPHDGTEITQFHTVLRQQDEADKSRLTDLQSVSSYVFADKVLLVEGVSDRLVLKKLSKALDPRWDFDQRSIPVLNAGGKGDVCRFKRFLEELGIETFVVFDVDAAKQECESVVTDESIIEQIGQFQDEVDAEFTGPTYSVGDLDIETRTKPWDEAFDDLESLMTRIEEDEETTDDDARLIEKILSKCEKSEPPNHLWASDSVEEQRIRVVEELLDKNILLLSGDIEDYYPYDGGGKRESAIRFDPSCHSKEELNQRFQYLNTHDQSDLEVFFSSVFQTQTT
ncbi:AAA family ATPase [Natrinema salaciae]|uniref:AAA ATPase domain-containing protein n=1 Tax=Natrinema salaciae TaxID=1186196 RepID=A0A1H9PTF9_9EURY|nr:AAA family ATPase [Natrinema salaciae]SER51410.1 AAA ATPase domain-containing protein [Natrinema salaciae]